MPTPEKPFVGCRVELTGSTNRGELATVRRLWDDGAVSVQLDSGPGLIARPGEFQVLQMAACRWCGAQRMLSGAVPLPVCGCSDSRLVSNVWVIQTAA